MSRKALLLTFAICSLACQSAFAQSDLGLKRLGAAVGLVSPENVDATVGFGVFADLGTITPHVRLEPRVDYWSQSEETVFGGKVSVRDIAFGARTKYFFTVKSKVKPFAGAGLGVHVLKAEVEVYDPFAGGTMSVDASETKVGFDLGAGLVAPVNARTSFLAETWYNIVSDFSQFHLRVGLSHSFGF